MIKSETLFDTAIKNFKCVRCHKELFKGNNIYCPACRAWMRQGKYKKLKKEVSNGR